MVLPYWLMGSRGKGQNSSSASWQLKNKVLKSNHAVFLSRTLGK
uniref:Uncharacterized protein n=1 Tax=Anguilla anguilla TaxID=7936 RepID=A0A0E9UH51_ANGAN